MQVVAKRSMEEESDEEGKRAVLERKLAKVLNCPRCNSNNTKFCYYNNYSLSQPRYFCKSCRRYWTAGGSLRNIPVGGASRKNKRPAPNFSSPLKNKTNHPTAIINDHNNKTSSSSSPSSTSSSCGWLLSDRVELIPFMPMPAAAPQPSSLCSTAADYNPSRNNTVNGFDDDEGGSADEQAARSLFSVEELKQLPVPTIINDQNGGKLGDVAGFWNGIFGGATGSWP